MSHVAFIVWAAGAQRDVRRLHDFLAAKNREAARRAARAIRQAIKTLARHPEMGRPVEDMLPGFRELVIDFGQSAYVALYRLDGEHGTVLAVRHGKEAGY